MNRARLIVVWITGLVIAGMCLYPPWMEHYDRGNRWQGYHWLCWPDWNSRVINFPVLATQATVACIIGGLVFITVGRKKD